MKKKTNKQQGHIRKIRNKLIESGRGKKDKHIGKMVWYKDEAYLVRRKNKNNSYNLINLTAHKEVHNVFPYQWQDYK